MVLTKQGPSLRMGRKIIDKDQSLCKPFALSAKATCSHTVFPLFTANGISYSRAHLTLVSMTRIARYTILLGSISVKPFCVHPRPVVAAKIAEHEYFHMLG